MRDTPTQPDKWPPYPDPPTPTPTSLTSAIVGSRGVFSKEATDLEAQLHSQFLSLRRVFQAHSKAEDDLIWPALREKAWRDGVARESLECALEEDHSDEEYIFAEIEGLLAVLEKGLGQPQHPPPTPSSIEATTTEAVRVLSELEGLAIRASENMIRHLQREETEVLPLIQRCFSREEMARLVGTILGERPGDLMDTILAMMFRNLTPEARTDMLKHVKHAVDGTFFDRWLSYVRLAHQGTAVAFLDEAATTTEREGKVAEGKGVGGGGAGGGGGSQKEPSYMACEDGCEEMHVEGTPHPHHGKPRPGCRMCGWVGRCPRESKLEPKEFEAAVRAIARDSSIGMTEKSKAVQTLRSCSWTQKRPRPGPTVTAGTVGHIHPPHPSSSAAPAAPLSAPAVAMPLPSPHRPPSAATEQQDRTPSHTASGELGCRHYRRACKLRATCCGRLYSCRLCHDEATGDHAMDRYAVTEICCMRCGELQPPTSACRNAACGGKFSAYYCDICRLYDDDAGKAIYHCPYCNVCRLGKGLGIDFRHCMTCNACVSLAVAPERHKCIEQALQRDCPVCSEPLFTSTTHYKVLSFCGHSMHRECYEAYRQTAYTCPICKKSMEDMTSHFAGLDLLLQAYPMPPEFASWRSDVLCQDCGEESRDIAYHFLYHKCGGCGSYNTRVLQAGHRGDGGGGGGGEAEGGEGEAAT